MNSSIYKKVITENDHNIFYDLLIPSWVEMGYPLECVLGDVSRYIVFNEEKEPVGTTEIIPYRNDEHSYLDQFFPFKEHHLVKKNCAKTAEIEALSIHPKYRRENNLERIIFTITEHARLNNVSFAIGLINPLLYLALRNTYKIPITRLGKVSNKAKTTVYPFMIDAENVYKNIDKFHWLYKIYESENNLARKIIYSEPLKTNSKESVNS